MTKKTEETKLKLETNEEGVQATMNNKAVKFRDFLDENKINVFNIEALADIQEKTGKETVIPGMEPTGHYWFNLALFLRDNGMQPVLVNPLHVKRSKELDDHLPSKNDMKDPKTIAKLVIEGRYVNPYLPEGIYAEIKT